MGRTIMGAVVSLDGRIAHDDDDVGPAVRLVRQWRGGWAFCENQESHAAPHRHPGTSCTPSTRGSVRW
jgi:hypothetical protein